MSETPIVDSDILRDQVREKYRAVAVEPNETYHFHTGRHSPPGSATTR